MYSTIRGPPPRPLRALLQRDVPEETVSEQLHVPHVTGVDDSIIAVADEPICEGHDHGVDNAGPDEAAAFVAPVALDSAQPFGCTVGDDLVDGSDIGDLEDLFELLLVQLFRLAGLAEDD